jgi:hypothetical protein
MRPSVREQLGEEALSRAKEALREPDGFGVFVRDGLYASGAAGVDRRLGVGEDDRRVGGEDQLRAGADEFVDASQEGEAVLGARPALWPGIAAGERRRPAHERSPAPCRSPGSNRRWGRCVGMVDSAPRGASPALGGGCRANAQGGHGLSRSDNSRRAKDRLTRVSASEGPGPVHGARCAGTWVILRPCSATRMTHVLWAGRVTRSSRCARPSRSGGVLQSDRKTTRMKHGTSTRSDRAT